MMLRITRIAIDGDKQPYKLHMDLEGLLIHDGPLGDDIVHDLHDNIDHLNDITFRERSMIEDLFLTAVVRPYLERHATGEIADIAI